MILEVAFAVVFKPPSLLVAIGAGRGVQVAIAIHIQNDQAMGFFQSGVDRMFPPGWAFEPNHSIPVSAAGNEINFPILIDVAGMNIGRTNLLLSNDMFLPRFGGICRSFPPREEVSH